MVLWEIEHKHSGGVRRRIHKLDEPIIFNRGAPRLQSISFSAVAHSVVRRVVAATIPVSLTGQRNSYRIASIATTVLSTMLSPLQLGNRRVDGVGTPHIAAAIRSDRTQNAGARFLIQRSQRSR